MTRDEWTAKETHRWALGIVLAIVLQALAFSFWAGRLQGTVTALVNTVQELHRDFAAHMNLK